MWYKSQSKTLIYFKDGFKSYRLNKVNKNYKIFFSATCHKHWFAIWSYDVNERPASERKSKDSLDLFSFRAQTELTLLFVQNCSHIFVCMNLASLWSIRRLTPARIEFNLLNEKMWASRPRETRFSSVEFCTGLNKTNNKDKNDLRVDFISLEIICHFPLNHCVFDTWHFVI